MIALLIAQATSCSLCLQRLSKFGVFRAKGDMARQFGIFSSFYLFNYAANWAALPVAGGSRRNSADHRAIGLSIATIAGSYFWHSRVTFRKREVRCVMVPSSRQRLPLLWFGGPARRRSRARPRAARISLDELRPYLVGACSRRRCSSPMPVAATCGLLYAPGVSHATRNSASSIANMAPEHGRGAARGDRGDATRLFARSRGDCEPKGSISRLGPTLAPLFATRRLRAQFDQFWLFEPNLRCTTSWPTRPEAAPANSRPK